MRSTEVAALDLAIDACVDFIRRQQSDDGCWIDWALPPGPSNSWNTAYVAEQLAALPGDFRGRTLCATRVAARWLVDHECAGGGWGYNDHVGHDADSTAHAILFLSLEGLPVAPRSDACLMMLQRPDGGFSTYPDDEGLGSWGRSHTDVSAVSARAMLTRRPTTDPAFVRAVAFVAGQRNERGLWNSFWWRSPLYATQASLSLLGTANARLDLSATRLALTGASAESPFERALLLDSVLRAGVRDRDRVDALRELLVAEQLADGSWVSVPMLRVTHRDCAAPWDQLNAGAFYADDRRLFTSATALRALCLARAAALHV